MRFELVNKNIKLVAEVDRKTTNMYKAYYEVSFYRLNNNVWEYVDTEKNIYTERKLREVYGFNI